MTMQMRRAVGAIAIATIVASCSTTPGALPATAASSTTGSAPPASSAAALPDGFPIGSWTTTITDADLRAGGLTGAGDLSENAGVFTLIMGEDGTWTTTQKTEATIRWPVFRGTWISTGSNSFSQRTDFPADFAGDVVDFTWKIENGNLVLELPNPPDPVLPIIMETHPWEPAD